jgi:hypothetical protein
VKKRGKLSIDATERGKGGGTRGEEGMLHRVEIDSDWRRKMRAPASDSSSLAAPNREEKGGERRGGLGFIVEVFMAS